MFDDVRPGSLGSGGALAGMFAALCGSLLDYHPHLADAVRNDTPTKHIENLYLLFALYSGLDRRITGGGAIKISGQQVLTAMPKSFGPPSTWS